MGPRVDAEWALRVPEEIARWSATGGVKEVEVVALRKHRRAADTSSPESRRWREIAVGRPVWNVRELVGVLPSGGERRDPAVVALLVEVVGGRSRMASMLTAEMD